MRWSRSCQLLAEEYAEQGRGFELRNVAGGWRYYTREEYAAVVEAFVLEGQQARLTQAALETLAVVAYKQPVSRARVSAIRGVNVDGVMRTLLTRGLVEEAGEDQSTGAHLYRTSNYFLERIGVESIDELPELAPYLPDLADMEDELEGLASPAAPGDARAGARAPSPTAAPSRRDAPGPRRRRADPAAEAARPVRRGLAAPCEELMLAGLVVVDGEVVTRLGTKVDPRTAVIRVDGKRLPPVSPHVYLALNKPRGVVSTMSDPEGRRTLSDVVADRPERLFHVGRLDTDTSGLIILTNDGDFAQRLAHPSYEVDKTYVAEVTGEVTKATLRSAPGRRHPRRRAGHRLADTDRRSTERQDDRRAGHPRGPQQDRPSPPRARRPPRHPAHPHPHRPGEARSAQVRRAPRPHPRRARRAAGHHPALRREGVGTSG